MTDLHSSQIRSLAEAANNITNPITEAPKAQTSSKEQEWANTHANLMREWFSHMSNQNVVDIFKIIKTKDYSAANMKKLKTYLMDAGITDRMGMVRPAKYQKPLDDIGALRSDETAVAIIKAGWAYFADRARPAAEAIAANKTASKNSPKVEEVETVEEGVLGDAAKKIIQKIKDIKSDYIEWRDLAKQLSQLKQERKTVLADIQASAQKRLKELDAEMQKAAQKRIKELNAELDRLKATDKERLGETVEEAANNISNPITEARTSPKEHEWLSDMKAKDVTAISKLLKSKDTKALEQYLIANRLMGRDGLVQGKNLDRSAIEIIKRSFADVHEEVQVEEVETVEEAVKIDRNMNIKEMAAVLMDIADALMGKNVVTQRERLIAVAQALASRRFV